MIWHNGHVPTVTISMLTTLAVMLMMQHCPTSICFTPPLIKKTTNSGALSFLTSPLQSQRRSSILAATAQKKKGGTGMSGSSSKGSSGGGMGMGGGGGGGGKNKKNKKAKQKKNQAPFDVSASVLRSEKLYEELCIESTKALFREEDSEAKYDLYSDEIIHTEYVIAARYHPDVSSGAATAGPPAGFASVSDWVPIAQLCINRPVSSESSSNSHSLDPRVRTAVSYYCRELYYAACLAAPIFKSIPRNTIQYSAEPVESFHRYVYEDVIEHKNHNEDNENVMTKSRAREVLGLEEGCTDVGVIKSAYKKKMLEFHPDRFVGVDRTEEEIKDAEKLYADARIAFDSLSSGVRSNNNNSADTTLATSASNKSWYASLGGRARTEFYGPIDLMSIDDAKGLFKAFKSAVAGLEYDTVMAFVARNQAAASSAAAAASSAATSSSS